MVNPKVSIVVPVYNTEKHLKRCIDSILGQSLSDIEVIIVDDGSKEECAKFCDEISLTDSRIKVIHKANGGLGFARNSGIEEAKGEYIGFVDSDDYIEPLMYESLYKSADKHNADLVVSGICFVGGNMFSNSGEYIKKSYFEKLEVFENEDIKKLLLGVIGALPYEPDDSRYGVSVCKNLFKTSLIKEKNIEFLSEREVLSEDTIFMVDYIKHIKKAVGVPGSYYCYVRNEGSLSKSYKSDRFEKSIIFLDVLEKRICDIVNKDEYKIYLDRLIQGFGRILCSQEIMYAKESKIKYKTLKNNLSNICTHQKIQNAIKTYPWYRLPVKQAAFLVAMKYKLFYMQKIMVILRDR